MRKIPLYYLILDFTQKVEIKRMKSVEILISLTSKIENIIISEEIVICKKNMLVKNAPSLTPIPPEAPRVMNPMSQEIM